MGTTDADRATPPGAAVKTGPIAYFAGNPVAANLLMLLIVVAGVVSGLRLPVQSYPSFEPRAVMVTVLSPGSSPKEVEEDINRRVEESLIGLPGVERVVSTATEGVGRITVELATFANADTVLRDVQSAVDRIENFPPINAEQPEVKFRQIGAEVMTLAVSSSFATEDELRLVAEDVRSELLELPSISQVTLIGTRDREIAIELSEEELRRNNLSFAEISRVVQRASLNLTFGELRTESGGVVLHTVSKRSVGEEFEDIPLITRLDGTIVTLGEVAEIRDGFVDEDIVSEVDGTPSVFVRIDGAEHQSIVDLAADVRGWLANYEAPQGIAVSVWDDRGRPILATVSKIIGNGVIGAVLVLILLLLAFDLRVAMWITLGIPISFIGSLIFFNPADLTLNLGTIIGFFLMVGLVVDDALVVGESIAAERDSGKSAAEAAVSGARAVVGPVTVGACTTILAFVPFLFVTTGLYQVVKVFPYVALFVLAVSLIEAFFILPAHLSHEGRWSLWPLRAFQDRVRGWIDEIRDRTVVPAVSWSVRQVWLAPVCGVLLVLVSLLLVGSDAVRLNLFDEETSVPENIQVELYLPVGTPFAATLAAAEQVADAAYATNDQFEGESIKAVSILVGNIGSRALNLDEVVVNSSHLAVVTVRLNERPARTASPAEIERAWRRNIGDVSQLERMVFRIARVQGRPPVSYALKHDDAEILGQATSELRSFLAAMPGIYELSDSLSLGKRHLEIQLTPAGKAAGLTPAAIGGQLRANFHGVEVQRIQRGHEEVKVVVRYPRERRQSLSELASERIYRPGGAEVPLSTVAQLTETRELATLMRIDGQQAAQVSARSDAAVMTTRQARQQIEREFLPGLIAKYPGLGIEPSEGARSDRDMLETLAVLVPIVLIAMYVLMAAFLRSYWKPLVAAVGVPVSCAGAILGHWVLGWDLTAMSLFGMIAIAGVVVNDALVLLDRYNKIRLERTMLPAIAAAAAATRYRFRAVFLTSATTFLGLAPLLYERSDELMFLVPFIVSLLSGLVLSGVFILFILPTLVMLAEGFRE